jgi:hypothetical protein
MFVEDQFLKTLQRKNLSGQSLSRRGTEDSWQGGSGRIVAVWANDPNARLPTQMRMIKDVNVRNASMRISLVSVLKLCAIGMTVAV